MTSLELAALLGVSRSIAAGQLSVTEKRGLVQRCDHRYTLTPAGEERVAALLGALGVTDPAADLDGEARRVVQHLKAGGPVARILRAAIAD